ncbi:MAG: hypothetical protein OEM91_15485, partial [Hyphomicrobiales bacterium]|nr:hypothetical protein [Hyphomicrobiales bacterium]
DIVYETETLQQVTSAPTLVAAVEKAFTHTSDDLEPAFYDQRGIYEGLGQQGAPAIVVAIWTSRWQTPFMQVLREDEFAPISLAISRGSDGAYYVIYKLVSHEHLTELRSQHEAETIGKFASMQTARAYCDLFNAARHSREWVSVHVPSAKGSRIPDGAYLVEEEEDLCRLYTAEPDKLQLGSFASVRIAEAYATAHQDAIEHFSFEVTRESGA